MSTRPGAGALIGVWLALLLLLAVTAASSRVNLGWVNLVVNLVVAAGKTALIAIFYIRLRGSLGAVRVVIVVALLIFSLLFGLSMADFLTRH